MANPDSLIKNILKGIRNKSKKFFHNPYRSVNINWFLLKYFKHLPSKQLHFHILFGHKTWFNSGPAYLHGIQEIFIEEVYKQQLPENAFVVDCGANIGLSIIYIKREHPSARIIAFEPDSQNFDLLTRNIKSHNIQNIELRKEAVWAEDTLISFIEKGNMESKIDIRNSIATPEVKAVRLKNYLNKKVDFLKLDIEGAEYVVLKDIAANLINVNSMFVEYHGLFTQNNELLEILEIINKAGFHFYIKESTSVYHHPFTAKRTNNLYDIQLNIFCFKNYS